MGNALRARKRVLFLEQLSVAAEAVMLGSAHEGHWETLAAFVQHEGIVRCTAWSRREPDQKKNA